MGNVYIYSWSFHINFIPRIFRSKLQYFLKRITTLYDSLLKHRNHFA